MEEKQVLDIKRLLDIDVSGFTNDMNTNAVRHIEKRHGENGIADISMSNISDIARVGYIFENYDNVEVAKNGLDEVDSTEFRNYKNEPVPMLVYSKKINGTYYIAQAIPDSKYKKLWIVSAYIKNKEAVTQALNTKNNSQVGMSLASPTSNESISDNSEDVKKKFSLQTVEEENELLKKENRRLEEINQALRYEYGYAQKGVAGGKKVREAAGRLKKSANSSLTVREISNRLNEIYVRQGAVPLSFRGYCGSKSASADGRTGVDGIPQNNKMRILGGVSGTLPR